MDEQRRRTAAMGALAFLMVGLLAAPAAAEGGFTTYFSGWLPGVSSRTWSDHNSDGAHTTIKVGGCRLVSSPVPSVNLQMQLTLETPWYQPDKNMGRKTFYCHSHSATGDWGDVQRGSYHFTLTAVDGTQDAPDKVRASLVEVRY